MPFVDRIIQFLQTQQGERIVVQNDELCMIYRPGGAVVPTKDRLTLTQVCTLVNEILPAEKRDAYARGEPVSFTYGYGGGESEIDVTQEEGNVRVSIGAPPSLV